MFNGTAGHPPPTGLYSSAEEWFARAGRFEEEASYLKFEEPYRSDYFHPKGLEDRIHWKFREEHRRQPPPTFLALIPRARVWGPKGAVITPDNKLLWDVSFNYGITAEAHPVFRAKCLPPVQYREESIAVLSFCASQYYYHWLFDVLPRLELLRQVKGGVHRLLMNFNGMFPFQRETLTALRIPGKKIIACHRHLHLEARQLALPSLPGYTGHMPKWSCEFLRRELLPYGNRKKGIKRERFYISRKNAGGRKVRNEDDVMGVLANYGFKKVALEKMSVAEQIRLFGAAETIVSAHGGGLANLVFCSPGTRVLEFFSPNYVNVLYWVLSNHVQLEYHYLLGQGKPPPEGVDPHLVGDHITVPLEQLEALLKNMIQ